MTEWLPVCLLAAETKVVTIQLTSIQLTWICSEAYSGCSCECHDHERTTRVLRGLCIAETKVALIQRSCGYASRPTLDIAEIDMAVQIIKSQQPDCLVVVDNCYGEFTDTKEPCAVSSSYPSFNLLLLSSLPTSFLFHHHLHSHYHYILYSCYYCVDCCSFYSYGTGRG